MAKFAERLKQLRMERGLSQYELGEILKISRSTLAGYEKENKEPNYETLKRFATFFDCSTDYLTGYSDERFCPDVVLQKNNIEFKKIYDMLPPVEKGRVAVIFDAVYSVLAPDVANCNSEKLSLYLELFGSISESRNKVRQAIKEHKGVVTDVSMLTPLVEAENEAKKEICEALDKLMQSELNEKLKNSK